MPFPKTRVGRPEAGVTPAPKQSDEAAKAPHARFRRLHYATEVRPLLSLFGR